MPNISATSFSKWQTCHRLYYWEELMRIQRVRDDGARRFGTMYHAGLEAWWSIGGDDAPWKDPDAPLVAAMKAIDDNARHVDTDLYEHAKAQAMMIAYHARWFELRFENVDGLDAGGVEEWFKVPLRDPDDRLVSGWFVTGKRDARKRFDDHAVRPIEHKTTSQEIAPGSDYWSKLVLDMQATMYIDAARLDGDITVRELLYDVSRKPRVSPERMTPEESRKFTKGKGCKTCGGRAGGKEGPARGTGEIVVEDVTAEPSATSGKLPHKKIECPDCKGSGWKEPPALYASQRLVDETPLDYRHRVAEELAANPEAYFRQGVLTRDEEQIAEARGDLVTVTGEIESMTHLAKRATKADMQDALARRYFTRNTAACMNIYGRRCDMFAVCAEKTNPWASPLYQIRPYRNDKKEPTP